MSQARKNKAYPTDKTATAIVTMNKEGKWNCDANCRDNDSIKALTNGLSYNLIPHMRKFGWEYGRYTQFTKIVRGTMWKVSNIGVPGYPDVDNPDPDIGEWTLYCVQQFGDEGCAYYKYAKLGVCLIGHDAPKEAAAYLNALADIAIKRYRKEYGEDKRRVV